jgi:hypothetical protein
VRAADAKPIAGALADYKAAGQTLIGHVAYGALVYGVQQYLAHSWVKGVGGNALYDFAWTDARIVKH